MHRTDYEKIAEAMRDCGPFHLKGSTDYSQGKWLQWRECVAGIAWVMWADNPSFDIDTFYDACGYVRDYEEQRQGIV
jgi:hypothetical protein